MPKLAFIGRTEVSLSSIRENWLVLEGLSVLVSFFGGGTEIMVPRRGLV